MSSMCDVIFINVYDTLMLKNKFEKRGMTKYDIKETKIKPLARREFSNSAYHASLADKSLNNKSVQFMINAFHTVWLKSL